MAHCLGGGPSGCLHHVMPQPLHSKACAPALRTISLPELFINSNISEDLKCWYVSNFFFFFFCGVYWGPNQGLVLVRPYALPLNHIYISKCYYFKSIWGVGCAQGLLLAPCSGSLLSAQGTIWGARD